VPDQYLASVGSTADNGGKRKAVRALKNNRPAGEAGRLRQSSVDDGLLREQAADAILRGGEVHLVITLHHDIADRVGGPGAVGG